MLFISIVDSADADGISEILAIGDRADGPMGRWESGCWDQLRTNFMQNLRRLWTGLTLGRAPRRL